MPLNTPNLLTLFRMALIPVVVALYFIPVAGVYVTAVFLWQRLVGGIGWLGEDLTEQFLERAVEGWRCLLANCEFFFCGYVLLTNWENHWYVVRKVTATSNACVVDDVAEAVERHHERRLVHVERVPRWFGMRKMLLHCAVDGTRQSTVSSVSLCVQ